MKKVVDIVSVNSENNLLEIALDELDMCCQTLCTKQPIYDYIEELHETNARLVRILEENGLLSELDDADL